MAVTKRFTAGGKYRLMMLGRAGRPEHMCGKRPLVVIALDSMVFQCEPYKTLQLHIHVFAVVKFPLHVLLSVLSKIMWLPIETQKNVPAACSRSCCGTSPVACLYFVVLEMLLW